MSIGIGFSGAGWMGRVLLARLLDHDDVTVRGLYQRNGQNAAVTLTELGLSPDLYRSDFSKLTSDPSVDAVFLCGPNSSHGPQSIAALEAGKHVFCEKPCATKFHEFQKQLELAEACSDQITFVDYLMNFDSMENRILDMVRDGWFGSISQIQVNYRHPINIIGDKKWKLDAEIMGDAIGMGIIHSLSVMLNIMAAAGARPVQVFARQSTVQERGFAAPPVYSIQVTFDSGALGLCFGNIDHANGYDAYHNIHGTGGGLIFDSYLDRPSKVRCWSRSARDGAWFYPLDKDRCEREDMAELAWPTDTTTPDSGDVMQHQTAECVAHFLQCVRKKEASFLSFPATRTTAELGWGALMSAGLNRPVDLPLDHGAAAKFFR